MRFIVDIDTDAMEEIGGKEYTPGMIEDIIEEAFDNAGLENFHDVEYDDQIPEADFND